MDDRTPPGEEEQKRTFSEHTAPQPEQVTIGRIVSYREARQCSLVCGIRRPLQIDPEQKLIVYRSVRTLGEQSANRKLSRNGLLRN